MNEPTTSIHEADLGGKGTDKKRLLILDDQTDDLVRAAKSYAALGYAVTPVILGSKRFGPRVTENGHLTEGDKCLFKGAFEYGAIDRTHLAAILNEVNPDAVLSDGSWMEASFFKSRKENRGTENGEALVDVCKELRPTMPCLINTGAWRLSGREGLIQEGGYDFITKDEDPKTADKYFKAAFKAQGIGRA